MYRCRLETGTASTITTRRESRTGLSLLGSIRLLRAHKWSSSRWITWWLGYRPTPSWQAGGVRIDTLLSLLRWTPCIGVDTLDPSHMPSVCELYHFIVCLYHNDCYCSFSCTEKIVLQPHDIQSQLIWYPEVDKNKNGAKWVCPASAALDPPVRVRTFPIWA